MDTIALWEQEIEENGKSHFFEKTQKQIEFLSESIELDYKLMDLGILREADEEENTDTDNGNDNSSNTSSSTGDFKIGEKIKMFFKKIGLAIGKLIANIRGFIQGKINDFKQKNIIKKFAGAKINPEQMAEKLNKTTLFDPNKLYDAYSALAGEILKFGERWKNGSISEDELDDPKIAKYSEKVMGYALALSPKDVEKAGNKKIENFDSIMVKIKPENAQKEITDLYTKTDKFLTEFENKVEEYNNDVKDIEKDIEKLNKFGKKEDVKSVKALIKMFKTLYNSSVKISGLCIKQCNVLQAIMVSFAMHQGGDENKDENKEENK